MRTVYIVSDSQLEELKRKQHQEELDNLGDQRKHWEEVYQARIKVLDEREHELKDELKVLSPAKKKPLKAWSIQLDKWWRSLKP